MSAKVTIIEIIIIALLLISYLPAIAFFIAIYIAFIKAVLYAFKKIIKGRTIEKSD